VKQSPVDRKQAKSALAKLSNEINSAGNEKNVQINEHIHMHERSGM
jgi:hypothetical protein